MYTGFVITNKGIEKFAELEIKELIKSKDIEKENSVVKFSFNDLPDLCTVTYMAQSISRSAFLLACFNVDKSLDFSVKSAKEEIKKIVFPEWLNKKFSFSVFPERSGEHDFKSVDIGTEVGKLLFGRLKELKYEIKTDYESPDILFYLYVCDNKGYFGIDFSGIDLSKRQYKIFNHPESLKGTTGYAIVRESGFNAKKSLLDPFMGSGIIAIEAALFASKFPVHYYSKDKLAFTKYPFFKPIEKKFFGPHDKKSSEKKLKISGYDSQFKYLAAAQKNAKLAGIFKTLTLSRSDIEWLDLKFKKNSVDIISTDPPKPSKHRDTKLVEKTYKEFFYQADFILKKNGIIVLLAREEVLIEDSAKKHNFKLIKNYPIHQGKEIFYLITFKRSGDNGKL